MKYNNVVGTLTTLKKKYRNYLKNNMYTKEMLSNIITEKKYHYEFINVCPAQNLLYYKCNVIHNVAFIFICYHQ